MTQRAAVWCRHLRTAVWALAALAFLAPAAWADGLAERLQSLVEQGRYPAAYELAQAQRSEREGEPRFDLYYGIAAIETGHLGEAVFALRRVLAAHPSAGVRIQLARAWFLLGEDLQARREFERALEADPPAPTRARIERYLYALDGRSERYRTTVRGEVALGGGYDSNVSGATDEEWVELLGQSVALDEDARARSDHFGRLAAKLRVSRPLVPDIHVFAELGGQQRHLEELDDYTTARVRLRGGVVLRSGDLRTQLAASSQRFWLGGDRYRDTNGLETRLRYAVSERQVAQLVATFAQRHHADSAQQPRDADLATLMLGTTRVWPVVLRPTLSVFVLYGAQRAEREEMGDRIRESRRAGAERNLTGAGAELELRIAPRWQVATDFRYRRSDYPLTDPLFGRDRRDTLRSGAVSLRWYPALGWRLQVQLRRSVNDSNIDFHSHERDVGEFGLRYQF